MPKAVRTALYRHWDDAGQLLYVGIALDPARRSNSHRERSLWFRRIARIDIQWCGSREEALDAEQKAIQTELPRFNIHHAKAVGAPLDQVERALKWAVLCVSTGLIDGWYRAEEDAQEVLDFLREEIPGAQFALINEHSAALGQQFAQFSLTSDEHGKWSMAPRNLRILAR